MRDIGRDRARAIAHQRIRRVAMGAAAVDDVVNDDAVAPRHIADHVHHLGNASAFAPLVDDGEVGVQAGGDRACPHHAADIGGDDHQVAPGIAFLDVLGEEGGCDQVIDRNIEEALDLAGMQIHCQHAVGACLGDQVGHQLGRNRRARAALPVLPGIAKIGDHRRHPPRTGTAQRVERDQQLHQVVIGRKAGGLDDEDILATNIFMELDEDLHIGEAPDGGLDQRQFQIVGNGLCEGHVAVAGDDFHAGSTTPPRRA